MSQSPLATAALVESFHWLLDQAAPPLVVSLLSVEAFPAKRMGELFASMAVKGLVLAAQCYWKEAKLL